MVANKDSVISQALTLSEADRLEVIEQLSESLGATTGVSTAWDAEIDRRLDDVENGRAQFIPWEQARRQIAGNADGAKS